MAAGSSEEADDTILVFPRYSAGAATSLDRIRRADALLQLTHAGYDMRDAADREMVGALVSWVRRLDCYALRYSDLADAVATLTALMRA
jgi:hypothetical protein